MRSVDTTIYFVTTNVHKFEEINEIFEKCNLQIYRLPLKGPEIQSDELKDIARYSARYVAARYKKNFFVEDAGLFIEALNGFPGPYTSYAYRTIGRSGILKILDRSKNRNARFLSVIAYQELHGKIIIFVGEVLGEISYEERGVMGFAYDAIFVPKGDDGRTFAEMSTKEKNAISHRGMSAIKLIKFLKRRI